MANTLKLPNMNEFSPGQCGGELRPLLEIGDRHAGDFRGLLEGVKALPGVFENTPANQVDGRARNVFIGMSQCGLFDLDSNTLTELGQQLLASSTDVELNAAFAKHILLRLHGHELIDVVDLLRSRGEAVQLQSIRRELRSRGFEVTTNEGNCSKLRLWMEKSGVIDRRWNVDEDKLHELVGGDSADLAAWRNLSDSQRRFLEGVRWELANGASGWLDAAPIKKRAEVEYGRGVFPEGGFRKKVLNPLADDGWLEADGTGARGGNVGRVKATARLESLSPELPEILPASLPPDLRALLGTPLSQIQKDLGSSNTHTKGIALELLALSLLRDVGLRPVHFRLRASETGGAEVDLVANGIHLHYSRWLVQCKNTKTLHLRDLAKEVGMAVILRAHVIVLVTTGRIADTVRVHAARLAREGTLQVVLVESSALTEYFSRGASAIIDTLRSQAEDTLRLKAVQTGDES